MGWRSGDWQSARRKFHRSCRIRSRSTEEKQAEDSLEEVIKSSKAAAQPSPLATVTSPPTALCTIKQRNVDSEGSDSQIVKS